MPQQHRPFSHHAAAASHPSIVANARLFLSLAIGESTRQAYTSGVRSYIRFIDSLHLRPAFPASIETLCLWVSSLASPPHRLKSGTCKVYLAGVINQHIEQGFRSPLDNAPPMLDRIFTVSKDIRRWFPIQP